MSEAVFRGKITFVNHEKGYATIDYQQNEKAKTIHFQIAKERDLAATRRPPKYRVGDEINFEIKLTPRGDRMNAHNVKVLYNTALERLINRAATYNSFKGYMKLVDDTWFVKEIESYLFFPLLLSKWEKLPENEEVLFSLTNLDKPNNIGAELQHSDFIPEYKTAQRHWKNKTPIDATVSNISPYGVYLDLLSDKLQGKLPVPGNEGLKIGDTVKVSISYLSKTKLVVEKIKLN